MKNEMVLDQMTGNCPSNEGSTAAAAARNELFWVVDHSMLHILCLELERERACSSVEPLVAQDRVSAALESLSVPGEMIQGQAKGFH